MSTENEVNEASNNEEVIEPSYEINSWEDLELPIDLLRGIYSYGFEKPSPIQKRAIKPLVNGKDVIAQAQSGTGKTATFTIGALSHVNLLENTTQILVLSPTRELSIQTANVMKGIGSTMIGLRVQTLVGGSSIEEDVFQKIREQLLNYNNDSIILFISGTNHTYFENINYSNVIFKYIEYDISKFYHYDYSTFRPNIKIFLSDFLL